MLTLFNSGFNDGIRRNMLNTFFLPYSAINDYSYEYIGSRLNIDPKLAEPNSIFENELVLICFIDRFRPEGYFFVPVRFGKAIGTELRGTYLHIMIRLTEFCYIQDLLYFNSLLINTLSSKKLPQLTNNDPFEIDDGYYAIQSESYLTTNYFQTDFDVWPRIAKQVSEFIVFKRNNLNPIFIVTKLKNSDIVNSGKHHLVLTTNSEISLEFRYANFNANNRKPPQIDISIPESILSNGKCLFLADNDQDFFKMLIKTKPFPDESIGGISLSTNEEQTIIADSVLSVKIRPSIWHNVQVVSAIILIILANIIVNIDFDNSSLRKIVFVNWQNPFLSIIQIISYFWLFKLFGKKPL